MNILNELDSLVQSKVDFGQLHQRIVDLLTEEFNALMVGIFVVDPERKFAALTAAAGEGGKVLLSRGLKFPLLEEISIHDFITESIVKDIICITDKTGVFYSTPSPSLQFIKFPDFLFGFAPFLPPSRFVLSVPLHLHQKVFGVLYLEHTEILDREIIINTMMLIINKIEAVYTAGL